MALDLIAVYPESIQLGKLSTTLSDRARVKVAYVDHNGFFQQDTVWVEGLAWEVMYTPAEATGNWISDFYPGEGKTLLTHCGIHKSELDSEIQSLLENTMQYLRNSAGFPPIKSGDVLLVKLLKPSSHYQLCRDHVNAYRVVGWGMRPSLGLTLIFAITRLLAFKHRVLSRYYAPNAPGGMAHIVEGVEMVNGM
jgi:hypothetical protein